MVDLTDHFLEAGPVGVGGPNVLLPSFTNVGWCKYRECQGTLSAKQMAIALRHDHSLAKYDSEWRGYDRRMGTCA